MSEVTTSANKSPGRVFYWVERIGNKIPNPFLLFVYLIAVLMLATALFSWLDVAVKNPASGELVKVNNLLSVAGMQWIFPNIIHNFSSFAPLGAILALVIGAGLAEKVGLLQALMYKMASRVSARYASYLVLFIAFFSHISSDAALVVMPPLGALMFLAVGRHPIAGLLAAIAGVASGFTANLLIVTTDVLLSGISSEATKMVDAAVHVSVIDNWYFMASSVIVLTCAGALLTDKFIEPRLPTWQGSAEEKIEVLTPLQNRGLVMSGIAALVFIAIIAALVVPEAAPLRDPQTGSVIPSPFIKGIVPIIILFFFTVGITYGVVTKQIKRPNDIPNLLTEPMKNMAGFIVMVFPLAQFVAFFNWSNMGKFMAIGLTDLLEAAGMSGAPAFLGLMFLSAFLCMFIASGSAIWSILAPIFVPMFMLLGFHPAFAQMIFRIADSSVLPLAPMSPFLPLFLGFLQRYRKDARLGTYYMLILPYPLVFFAVWILLLLAWYALGLPIGPGVYPKMG
ncbi:p-aminobenzoyl-glutamate transporter [Serratia rubidaea]|uniref:p-aminobenzoyl-glutamate transporter n=1 Tax=Serratia rubidaea TaxID=61652 RepID=UPI000773F935|nr:p-aminobenzoyl-glutamate transporter [Serratia rubidaea]AML56985.1 Aminobenzoyl-glutamate transport protein [Serratia rubidaea]WBF46191.1 p-aminobenzoyl-glutamate transporter [Serratia rubidaea]